MAEYLDKDGTSQSELEQPRNPEAYQRKWMTEISRAERYFQEWVRKGELLVKLYRKQNEEDKGKRKFAMLWSNTEILKPSLYARVPEPIISRRFKDKDPPGRVASEILERASMYIFQKADFDSMMRGVRDDMLLPGRGTGWVRYVSDGVLALDYVHWRDFLHQPGRRWSEVGWVAKRSYFSKQQLLERWPDLKKRNEKTGAAKIKALSPDNVPRTGNITDEERKALEGKYSVWEIWSREDNTVCFLSPTAKEPLEITRPFLQLEGFWPCPRPIFATLTTDSLIPIPDYKFYQDQAEEIDDLTRRIGALTDSLKMVGFYPKGSEAATEIEKALDPAVQNRMIGVESWAAFSEKGGIKAIVFLPIEEVVKTLQACIEIRRQQIEDVYQITGISDIMRGSTDPDETLGAQQLKAQTGSVRIRDRQQDIQRFARDTLAIMCEIIAEKFTPGTLLQMTNMMTDENNTPEMKQTITKALALLRNDRMRGFQIDIETDSTVQPDEDAEKQRRTEFATAMGTMFKEAIPMVQQVPELLPLVGETLRFVVRGFRAGRQLEDVMDKTLKVLEQQAAAAAAAKQNAPPQPTKEQIDQRRLEEVDKPLADAQIAEYQARTAKVASEALEIPSRLGMEQDQMLLGEGARQEEREDAETERQDGIASEAADRQIAGMERGDRLSQQGFDNDMAQQAAAQAPTAAPVGPGAMSRSQLQALAPAPVQGGVAKVLEALAASMQQNSQMIQQLAAVVAAPTVVDTPRGRYVARKALQ